VLRLAHERVESSLHVWQLLSDVVHEDLQRGGKSECKHRPFN
jgi:hypothetical protein